MTGDGDKSTNSEALRLIAEVLSRHRVFGPGHLKPSPENPRELRVGLDESRFRGADEVYIEVQWYTDGDYNFHYQEIRSEKEYRCRWDKHAEYSAERLPEGVEVGESFRYFHPPPDASYKPRVRDWKDDHVRDLICHIRLWIQDRIEELWDE